MRSYPCLLRYKKISANGIAETCERLSLCDMRHSPNVSFAPAAEVAMILIADLSSEAVVAQNKPLAN